MEPDWLLWKPNLTRTVDQISTMFRLVVTTMSLEMLQPIRHGTIEQHVENVAY